MPLPKRYNPRTSEPALQAWWAEQGTYRFRRDRPGPVYAIDTPPATVSGHLHLGHAYSYTQTDFAARFWRMLGHNVFYPMGFDDNGLPTERYVERRTGQRAAAIGARAFAKLCLEVGAEGGREYEALWKRLGLSVDWEHTYRTIEPRAVRVAQVSFLQLYDAGLVYRSSAPAIWCPECQTSIAQADLDDLERDSTFYTLRFELDGERALPIATTRPELLPACVAVFVHPDDDRYRALVGKSARVPLFGQTVPILTDAAADPLKGSGAVMCCTFGDQTDVEWWRTHGLGLVEAIDRSGRMTAAAGRFAGLPIAEARSEMTHVLDRDGVLLGAAPVAQSVRIHERCDTPVEYILSPQWFLRVLDHRDELIEAGERIRWHPPHMGARYRQWVENLAWDWCLSRQRTFGVPFPLWHCQACGEVVAARPEALPVDPSQDTPPCRCPCGGDDLVPETDVMDTWATSSLTPQIAGRWLDDPELHAQVFPMSVRPQAHDIIRTWAFYTIVKSLYHFGHVPWTDVAISGWGIAGEGAGKISKSRGGGPMPPQEMIDAYSADAVRYWAASTGLGKDSVISETKIQLGQKLVNKLWNVARFGARFLDAAQPSLVDTVPAMSPADRWIVSRTQRLIRQATDQMRAYEYAGAKAETEAFFWTEFADNYLEMAKLRLYDKDSPSYAGARSALYHVLLATLKLFAPFLPHVTERIYRELYATAGAPSIHTAAWPEADARLESPDQEALGQALVAIATVVRRYKSEHGLALGAELRRLELTAPTRVLSEGLASARADLQSICRVREVCVVGERSPGLEPLTIDGDAEGALLP